MLRTISKYYDIRSGEGTRVALMFFYVFSVVAFVTVVKSVSTSLFLSRLGVGRLPHVFILVALCSGIVVWAYDRVNRAIPLPRQITFGLSVSVAGLILFWIILPWGLGHGWFLFLFYTWACLAAVVVMTQFWLLAGRIFNVREAKRAYSLLGTGAIVGGIFGGYATDLLAPLLGSRNLLLLGAALLSVCLLLKRKVIRKSTLVEFNPRAGTRGDEAAKGRSAGVSSTVLRTPLLACLAGLVVLGVVSASLVEYQFSAAATRAITDPDKLTAFWGFWMSTISVVSLFVQVLLTQRVVRVFGVGATLAVLPAAIVGGAVGILLVPGLSSAVFAKVIEGCFRNSINKSGQEILFLPVPSAIRNQAKTFIDVFVDNASKGVGGILLIVLVQSLGLSPVKLSFIVLGLAAGWALLIFRTRKEYVNSFRAAIESRSIEIDPESISLRDPKLLGTLLGDVERYNDRQLLFVLNLLDRVPSEGTLETLMKLLTHGNAQVRTAVLRLLNSESPGDARGAVTPLVADPEPDVRVAAMRYLSGKAQDPFIPLQPLLADPNPDIVSSALICASMKLKESKPGEAPLTYEDIILKVRALPDRHGGESSRVLLAKVIAISADPRLQHHLKPLLEDDSVEVQKEAIDAAGAVRHVPFIPLLVERLHNRPLRSHARHALASYGEDVLAVVEDLLGNDSTDPALRVQLVKTLGSINSQRSMDCLLSVLSNDVPVLTPHITSALARLRDGSAKLRIARDVIENQTVNEMGYYNRLIESSVAPASSGEGEPAREGQIRRLLHRALGEKSEDTLKRIFGLLALLYGQEDMRRAYLELKNPRQSRSAHAIEFLDNVVGGRLKRLLVPLAERYVHPEHPAPHAAEPTTGLRWLVEGKDGWLAECASHLTGHEGQAYA